MLVELGRARSGLLKFGRVGTLEASHEASRLVPRRAARAVRCQSSKNWPLEGGGGYVVHWSRYIVTTLESIW